ncbi:MAG: hypothetical protein Q4B03_01310 [Lachnospiraceae bacterium]|nr:hypothetical protein [Lachnospiraceae bacterium]
MKKRRILMLLCCLSLMGCSGTQPNDNGQTEATSQVTESVSEITVDAVNVSIDLSEIKTIQFNTAKMSPDRVRNASALLENLLQPKASNIAEGKERGDEYHTICLHYNNGEKKLFYFFLDSEEWYMERTDGTVYKDAGFIKEYIGGDAILSRNVETIGIISSLDEEILSYEPLFDDHDLPYHFYVDVQYRIKDGETEENAIAKAKETLKYNLILYNYAKNAGYTCSKESVDHTIEQWKKSLGEGDDIARYLSKSRDTIEAYYIIGGLELANTESFREGNDEIAGKVCDTVQEYWSQFLMEVVYPGATEEELSEIEAQLDAAEALYYELSI